MPCAVKEFKSFRRSVRYTLSAIFRVRAKLRCHDRGQGQGEVDMLPQGNLNEGRLMNLGVPGEGAADARK